MSKIWSKTQKCKLASKCGYEPYGHPDQVKKLIEMHKKVCNVCKNNNKPITTIDVGYVGETARREDINKEIKKINIDPLSSIRLPEPKNDN